MDFCLIINFKTSLKPKLVYDQSPFIIGKQTHLLSKKNLIKTRCTILNFIFGLIWIVI